MSTPLLGNPAEIEEKSAVQLFLSAAQRQRFGFSLTEQNREAIVRICHLVDGLSLGLELAAAWTHMLSCQEIADKIASSLDFLAVPARDRPARHRSMLAVFDHSWRLLSVEEQPAIRQLSVFRGSFGLEAAEQVAGATISILSALADKSLLHRTGTGRYDLHELIRQYSTAKLREAGEEQGTQQKHFDYFCSLAEIAAPHLTSAQWKLWVECLQVERDNLRTALGWSQAQSGNSESMLRLAGALYWFWFHRDDLSEGRAWLESALRRAGDSVDPITRARALYGAGRLAHLQGDNDLARPPLVESVALWRASGALGKQSLAFALVALGRLARDDGDLAFACSLITESLALFKEQDDRWGQAYALDSLALVLRDESDFAEARSLMEASITLWWSWETRGDSPMPCITRGWWGFVRVTT